MSAGEIESGIELLRRSDVINFPLLMDHFPSYVVAGISRKAGKMDVKVPSAAKVREWQSLLP
jgi:hypothetical protein